MGKTMLVKKRKHFPYRVQYPVEYEQAVAS